MASRRKIHPVFNDFIAALKSLERLDEQNQKRFRKGPGPAALSQLTKNQMTLITEALMVRAFSEYEKFLEEVFLLYCLGKSTLNGKAVTRHIEPIDFRHARDIIKSGMRFIEWNDPDAVLNRCEIYLSKDNPIWDAITQTKTKLTNARRIRNAIAHRSAEAEAQYLKTLRSELGVPPLTVPSPGEFLQQTDPAVGNQHFLLSYFSAFKSFATLATS